MSEVGTGAVDVLDLLKAIQRRGGGKPPVDPLIGEFESLRTTAAWTGVIYESQITTLKRGAMLIGGGPVTMAINTEERTILVEFGRCQNFFQDLQKAMEDMVKVVLGPGWRVTITGNCEPHPAPKGRKSAKPSGKRGAKKGARRRR